MGLEIVIGLAAAALAAGVVVGHLFERRRAVRRGADLQSERERIIGEAEREASNLRKSAELSGKEEAYRLKAEWEKEVEGRRHEVERSENRLAEREGLLDRKLAVLDEREDRLGSQASELQDQTRGLERTREELGERSQRLEQQLEKISGLTRDEARKQLIGRIEDEARAETARRVRDLREQARREAEREAKKIISQAIEKLAVDHASETTVSVVALPSDDMKGRIIGREGRNIRSFEAITGVDVVVDDTPEAVILSSFDPVRREAARLAMERLVADGRIHPGRIEEIVAKAHEDVLASMREAAEEVLYELGIHDLHAELADRLGVLRYRTSYGQNQLQHAREVALLGANMAAELGLDTQMVKRMGLLHDIGKALTHEHEGSHVELGYELCKRCGEKEPVLNAIRAHHDEEPAKFPETFLVTAADAISGARPGARRESFEHYVKRLEKLEKLASSFDGVEKVFAIQAGREIRIMVTPDSIGDKEMAELSEETARRIEEELQYPGQIKVVVVRETRAVDFAR
jgi:ribonuclease Y